MGTLTIPQTRQHDGRYTVDKRDGDGWQAVTVDGVHVGYVMNQGYGSAPWIARGTGAYDCHFPDGRARRWQAAERLVGLKDERDRRTAETERERMAAAVPDGWRVASWDEIVREGYRLVRPVKRSVYVDPATPKDAPDAGPRYATAYGEPIRLRSVSRCGRASAKDHAKYGDFIQAAYEGSTFAHSVSGNHRIALGALVPVDMPTLAGAGECEHCPASGTLYLVGADPAETRRYSPTVKTVSASSRALCIRCTLAAVPWKLDDIPHPTYEDGAEFFHPGATVALDVTGEDGRTDTYTGTVKEWTALLDGSSTWPGEHRTRTVRVAFPSYMTGGVGCDPDKLRAVDAVAELDPAETPDGWRAGDVARRYDYNRDGVAFEKNGFVVGVGTDETGAPVVRFTSSPVLPARVYPTAEMYRPGSHEDWAASRGWPRKTGA